MQESVTPQSRFSLWLWLRMGIAALMFSCGVLEARKGFLHFAWVPWFCMGMYNLIDVPRHEGEPIREYFRKPRAIASNAFLLAGAIGFGYVLYALLAK
jgi:hypothetical protein